MPGRGWRLTGCLRRPNAASSPQCAAVGASAARWPPAACFHGWRLPCHASCGEQRAVSRAVATAEQRLRTRWHGCTRRLKRLCEQAVQTLATIRLITPSRFCCITGLLKNNISSCFTALFDRMQIAEWQIVLRRFTLQLARYNADKRIQAAVR